MLLAPCGPLSTAFATLPIQLSPAELELPLCCEKAAFPDPAGMRKDTAGRAAFAASVKNCPDQTRCEFWAVYRHSANDGQPDQMYAYGSLPPLDSAAAD